MFCFVAFCGSQSKCADTPDCDRNWPFSRAVCGATATLVEGCYRRLWLFRCILASQKRANVVKRRRCPAVCVLLVSVPLVPWVLRIFFGLLLTRVPCLCAAWLSGWASHFVRASPCIFCLLLGVFCTYVNLLRIVQSVVMERKTCS